MLAKELQPGDQYRDDSGRVQVTVILGAKPDGINPLTRKPQVHVGVEHADGGHSPRWFDADDEVPYTRPEPQET
jgi:hypothetical protein